MKNSLFSQIKKKSRITIWCSNSTSGYKSRKKIQSSVSKWYLYTYVYTTLFPLAKRWKQTNCLSKKKKKWVNNMWCIHTIDYKALKIKGILTCDATWMNLEGIMLSQISLSQKKKNFTFWFYLYMVTRVVKLINSGSRTVVARS